MRIIFMGTPAFAVPSLEALASNHEVIAVFTRPDAVRSRGRALEPSPVKVRAEELGIPVCECSRISPDEIAAMRELAPDLIAVAAYGAILPDPMLDIAPKGCINVHASLLPRWRGASPIQAAILNGDTVSGVTIMQMDPGIDTGPMLKARELPIESYDTTVTLSAKMADLAAELLIEVIPDYAAGRLLPQPQPEEGACYTGMISKADGMLDFTQSAEALVCKVHAYNPWPCAMFEIDGETFKVYQAHAVNNKEGLTPGTRTVEKGLPAIAAADGLLALDELQAPGKKAMPGKAFLAGYRKWQV